MDTYMTSAGRYPIANEHKEEVIAAINDEIDLFIYETHFRNNKSGHSTPYFPITLNTPTGIIVRGEIIENGNFRRETLAELRHDTDGLLLIVEKFDESLTSLKGIHEIGQKNMRIN